MPTPKSKRDVLLQSSFSSTQVVATLGLGMDAQFNTPAGTITTNLFEDASGSDDESTDYQMTFAVSSTAQIGVITISFLGEGDNPVSGLTVAKTRAVSDIDPAPTTTTVTPIANPDAFYTRSWQQPALDSSEVAQVDQIGALEVRVKASAGYTVTQTVTSTAEDHLVLTYAWSDSTGQIVTGTLNFTASSVAGSGFSLGKLNVSDTSSSAGARLTAGRLKDRVGRGRGRGRDDRGRGHDRDKDRDDRGHGHGRGHDR